MLKAKVKNGYRVGLPRRHFKCSRCGKACKNLTHKKTVIGIDIIPDDKALCQRCTTWLEKQFTKKMLAKHGDKV